MNGIIKKQLMEEISEIVNCRVFHFTTTLSKFGKDLEMEMKLKNRKFDHISIPKHQRTQCINKQKEQLWIAGMLVQSLYSIVQTESISVGVATRFALKKTSKIANYNTQRFGIWYNTDLSNGYGRMNLEEGAHRMQYYSDFVANDCVLKESIFKKMMPYEAEILSKLFKVCNTDFISYSVLKDFDLTSLITDVPVDVDVIESSDPKIGAQMFINMNSCVSIKGPDVRKNRFADFYLYELASELQEKLAVGEDFSLGGATYSKEDIKNLRYILPLSRQSAGKALDIIARCMMADKDLKDGHNWAVFLRNQDNVFEHLFKRYPSKTPDMNTSADFYSAIKKIAKLGEILRYTVDNLTNTTSFLGVGTDKHNYASGAAALPAQFILFYNDIEKEFPGITTKQYSEIFKSISYAFTHKTKQAAGLSEERFKDTPHNYTVQRQVADAFVAIAKDMLKEK